MLLVYPLRLAKDDGGLDVVSLSILEVERSCFDATNHGVDRSVIMSDQCGIGHGCTYDSRDYSDKEIRYKANLLKHV
jgi:hypothetical protein